MRTLTVLACVSAVVFAAGCATMSKGPSDEEQVAAVLKSWEETVLAKDLDAMLALHSDDFEHTGFDFEASGKDELRGFMEDAVDMGYFDGVEIAYEPDAIVVDGDTAEIYPIDFVNDEGAVVVTMKLKKEADAWLIADMEIQGL